MLLGLILQAVTAFTSIPDSLPHLLNGHFQSCADPDTDDGSGYGELAFEYQLQGRVRWTFHMGPRDEFALFVGAPAEHFDHGSTFNRLTPAYHYDDVKTLKGGRNWSVWGLHVNVIRVPASDDECRAFLVRVDDDLRGKLANR